MKKSLLALALVALIGCGSVLQTLETVVAATEAAIPVLQATGVPIPPQVLMYVTDVATCIAQPGTTVPPTQEYAAIAACLASQVVPQIPGLSPALANMISAIAKDVANFVAQNTKYAVKLHGATMSSKDVAKLVDLQSRARVVVAKLKIIKK